MLGFLVIQSRCQFCRVSEPAKESVISNASQFRFANSIMRAHYLLTMSIKMKKTEISFRCTALAAFCSLCLFSGGAFAANPPAKKSVVTFDLPAQSLQSGLVEFAIQAKVSILVDHQLIKGYESAPLTGPQKRRLHWRSCSQIRHLSTSAKQLPVLISFRQKSR